MRARVEVLGDAALVLHFGECIDERYSREALAFAARLEAACWPGIVDIVPAYASVTVCYDPSVWLAAGLRERITALPSATAGANSQGAEIEIPVCYEAGFAPDMESVCEHTGLGPAEVVRRHCATTYRVYFLGFVPGFPYLGGLDPALHVPRRASPRREVPSGGVAIGGAQTGVYPLASPGGWNLIGRTPLALFDAARDPPCLLRAGDYVRFVPVTSEEYARLAATAAGRRT